jgi:hypothetical protein
VFWVMLRVLGGRLFACLEVPGVFLLCNSKFRMGGSPQDARAKCALALKCRGVSCTRKMGRHGLSFVIVLYICGYNCFVLVVVFL